MSDIATYYDGRVDVREPGPEGQDYLAQIDVPQSKVAEIVEWAYQEVEKAKAERGDLEDRIVEWERLYEARPKVKNKTFPWDGASNLMVPVIATAVDAVLARLMNSIFGAKELWVGTARSPQWVNLIDPIQHWINWVGDEVMDMYRVCQKWFLSMLKTGTGILKLPWERRRRNVVYKDAGGQTVSETIVVHDGPRPAVIPLSDFFFSSDALTYGNVQTCEWVCQRTFKTWKELVELEASKIYLDVKRIKDHKRSETTKLEEEVQENVGVQVSEYKDYEIWEMWASYDVNNDGIPEELVLTIQPDARVALRAVFNFFRHQERPLHLIRFMPRDNALLGIGLCQMLQDIQEEVTAIHNQRLDNATLANTAAFKRRKGALIGQDSVFPGGFIDVDTMDDLQPLEYGRIHHTLLPEELHTNSIGEKRSGVSDYTVGRESAAIGSRATATSTLALIREGNKRFAMTIRDIREGLGDVAHQVIMLYQQFVPDGDAVMYELFSPKERQIVQRYFALPAEYSRTNILLDTPALSEYENKELTRQGLMALMGIIQGFYGGLFQAMSLALAPEAPEPLKQLAIQGAKTGSMVWQRLLESFDFRDAEEWSPDIDTLLAAASTLEGVLGMGGGNGQGGFGPAQGGPEAAPVGGRVPVMEPGPPRSRPAPAQGVGGAEIGLT